MQWRVRPGNQIPSPFVLHRSLSPIGPVAGLLDPKKIITMGGVFTLSLTSTAGDSRGHSCVFGALSYSVSCATRRFGERLFGLWFNGRVHG